MRKNYRRYSQNHFSLQTVVVVTSVIVATLFLLGKIYCLQNTNEKLLAATSDLKEQNKLLQTEVTDLKTIKGGVEEHGSLSVKGTQLYDQKGEPLVLRGMSSHGLAWYPEYTNYRSLKTLKEYGANVFRIAMYVAQNDGYLEEPELNEKLLYQAIENSLAADLYTIVDWHVLRDKNPNYHLDEALTVFEEVARRYGDEPGIIYEICNEPNGDTSYEEIVEYANQVIPVIRKYAPDALILVGTPNFCTSLAEAIDHPLPFDNIMYTYHYYSGISDCQFARDEITRGIEKGLPVFVSEWGLDEQEQTYKNWEDTDVFLNFLDKNNISWVNWSLCNKDEGYSMIAKNENKLHGWEMEELTETGRYVVRRLQEK